MKINELPVTWLSLLALGAALPSDARNMIETDDGKPLAAATVRIVAARQNGPRPHRPNWDLEMDDPAVGRTTVTAADGSFSFTGRFASNRLYHLGIFAAGRRPFVYWGFDPRTNSAVIRLPATTNFGTAKYLVHGRVVDTNGAPVAGALVERDGLTTGQQTTWPGPADGWKSDVMTDTNGEFYIGRDDEFDRVQLRIRASGLAPAMAWLATSNVVQTIRLDGGISLRGRVVKDGQPLGGLRIESVGADRDSEYFAGHLETRTGADGRFEFKHLPSNTGWYISGIISSVHKYGNLGPKLIGPAPNYSMPRPMPTSAPWTNASVVDIGDWAVKPGLRLAGHVRTRGGEPLPKVLNLSLEVENTWVNERIAVDKNGAFSMDGLPDGLITVSMNRREWHFSGANRSLDVWSGTSLSGKLEGNKEDLALEIEMGKRTYDFGFNNGNGQLPRSDWPAQRPFEGAERSGSPMLQLTGEVLDDDSGKPLGHFTAIPGYKPASGRGMFMPPKTTIQKLLEPLKKKSIPWNEMPFWNYAAYEDETNGTFSLRFLQLSSTPMFRIYAQGYEPYDSEPITNDVRHFTIRLKHGAGPHGIVLLPDGTPADGTTIIYAVANQSVNLSSNQLRLNGPPDRSGTILQKTGRDGRFAFAPRAEPRTVLAASKYGWAEVPAENSGGSMTIRLEPWAAVKGQLVYSNGAPAAGTDLVLWSRHSFQIQTDEPYIYMNARANTDKTGAFVFPIVPPGKWTVQRRIPITQSSWRMVEQTWFVADPGVTNDLGKVTYDTPPPLPLTEQLKQRLGLQ